METTIQPAIAWSGKSKVLPPVNGDSLTYQARRFALGNRYTWRINRYLDAKYPSSVFGSDIPAIFVHAVSCMFIAYGRHAVEQRREAIEKLGQIYGAKNSA